MTGRPPCASSTRAWPAAGRRKPSAHLRRSRCRKVPFPPATHEMRLTALHAHELLVGDAVRLVGVDALPALQILVIRIEVAFVSDHLGVALKGEHVGCD